MAETIDYTELNYVETITSAGIKLIENKDSCSECINGNKREDDECSMCIHTERRENEIPCKFCDRANSISNRSYCNIELNTLHKVLRHENICEGLTNLYLNKNHDYNDSFAKGRKEVPNYVLGKLHDKFERFKQLTKNVGYLVIDETIEDTLIDLANYCIMELIERKSKE